MGKLSAITQSRLGSNGNAANAKFSVGGSNPGQPTVGGGGGAKFSSAVRIVVGRLLAAPPPPYSPDQGSNRRPKRLRSAALPFGHCLV